MYLKIQFVGLPLYYEGLHYKGVDNRRNKRESLVCPLVRVVIIVIC